MNIHKNKAAGFPAEGTLTCTPHQPQAIALDFHLYGDPKEPNKCKRIASLQSQAKAAARGEQSREQEEASLQHDKDLRLLQAWFSH